MGKNGSYESKFSGILTMTLVVILVIILGIAGYFLYSIHEKTTVNNAAQAAIADFEKATKSVRNKVSSVNKTKEETTTDSESSEPEVVVPDMSAYDNLESDNSSSTSVVEGVSEKPKVTLQGYDVMGRINIPKTNCDYPVLGEVTKHSLEIAVAILYGPGLNQPGNTVIVGHNYRNGMFFSNNSKLSNGDKITITSDEETLDYIIYNTYYTTPNDADYMKRAVDDGVREISLSTCNNDSSQRLIIWAREKGK